MERLVHIDQDITLWLNGFHSAATDQLWMFLSDVRVWFPAYLIIFWVMVRRLGWKKGVIVILSCILTVILTDQLSAQVKDSIQRLRPLYTTELLQNGLHWPQGRYSFFGFFSGHASNAFGFAVCSLLGFRLNDRSGRYRLYGWCIFIWATLVALSRVMMAAHYFGDVLVGALFGISVGLLLAGLSRGAIRYWMEKPVTA